MTSAWISTKISIKANKMAANLHEGEMSKGNAIPKSYSFGNTKPLNLQYVHVLTMCLANTQSQDFLMLLG